MGSKSTATPSERPSAIVAKANPDPGEVTWAKPGILEVRFNGHVTGESTRRLIEEARRALLKGAPQSFIINCLGATNYHPDVREPGVKLLELLRTAGAPRGCAVSRSPTIRMIGTAVAFVSGTKVTFVETRIEALALLEDTSIH